MQAKTNQTYKTSWSPAMIFLRKKILIPVSFSQRTFFSLSIGVNQHLIDLFRNIIDSDDGGRTKPSKTVAYWHAGYHGPHSFSLTAAPAVDA